MALTAPAMRARGGSGHDSDFECCLSVDDWIRRYNERQISAPLTEARRTGPTSETNSLTVKEQAARLLDSSFFVRLDDRAVIVSLYLFRISVCELDAGRLRCL